MSIYRPKGSPYFHYDFTRAGQRYYGSTGCTSKRDADRVEAEHKRKVATGEKTKTHITVDDAFGTWWANRGKHHRSAATSKGQLGRMLKAFGPTTRLADVTFAALDDFSARRRATVSNTTVNRDIETFRRVHRYTEKRKFDVGDAIEWGHLMLPEPKERTRELSSDEESRLMLALPADLAAVVEFALLSGQRKTAVVTLLWSKVDFRRGVASIKLKAEADQWHEFPLTPRMIALLANRPKICAQVFTYECRRAAPARKDRPPRVAGRRYPFSQQGWDRQWRAAKAVAQIDDFRFHDLRHTGLTRVTRAAGLKVANRLAGHTTLAATARYAHATETDVLAGMIAAENPRNSTEEFAVEAIALLKSKV